eukprot:SAG22_NODE_512_length_9579_cov_27.293143_12_plen_157_part_01
MADVPAPAGEPAGKMGAEPPNGGGGGGGRPLAPSVRQLYDDVKGQDIDGLRPVQLLEAELLGESQRGAPAPPPPPKEPPAAPEVAPSPAAAATAARPPQMPTPNRHLRNAIDEGQRLRRSREQGGQAAGGGRWPVSVELPAPTPAPAPAPGGWWPGG